MELRVVHRTFRVSQSQWSFDVPRVVSINTSGHKFGLVYPGLGWVLWRDGSYLHKELIFELRIYFYLVSFPSQSDILELFVDNHGVYVHSVSLFPFFSFFFEWDFIK
jgi:hypothetical protein